jgi:hypothetical protein
MVERGYGENLGSVPSLSVMMKMMRDKDIKEILSKIEVELRKSGLDSATIMKLAGELGFGKK